MAIVTGTRTGEFCGTPETQLQQKVDLNFSHDLDRALPQAESQPLLENTTRAEISSFYLKIAHKIHSLPPFHMSAPWWLNVRLEIVNNMG